MIAILMAGDYGKADSVIHNPQPFSFLVLPGQENSQEAFRRAVWQERSWELAYEGNWWFDMLRTNSSISGSLVGYDSGTGTFKPFNKYFPIPQREIDNNTSLVQNEGY